jgi:glycosyltransferase involved in cell wall biosynthesis
MARLQDVPGLLFLVVGGGARLAALQAGAARRGLGNVRFLPHQPRERLAQVLAAADLHVVTLLPGLDDLIMPSKLYGILAAGRPMLFIGAAGGSTARWVEGTKAGVAVATGDAAAAEQAIRRLVAAPELVVAWGRCARSLHEFEHTPERAAAHWQAVLAPLGARS